MKAKTLILICAGLHTMTSVSLAQDAPSQDEAIAALHALDPIDQRTRCAAWATQMSGWLGDHAGAEPRTVELAELSAQNHLDKATDIFLERNPDASQEDARSAVEPVFNQLNNEYGALFREQIAANNHPLEGSALTAIGAFCLYLGMTNGRPR